MKKLPKFAAKHLLLSTAYLFFNFTYAKIPLVAIIDSGTDVAHPTLASKALSNSADPIDGVDNDHNGYIDDFWGWNFVDSNNEVFAKKFVNSFREDVYKFFEIVSRRYSGDLNPEDQEWISARKKDPIFLAQVNAYGGYAHGTHVADISTRQDPMNFFVAKIIATNIPDSWDSIVSPSEPVAPATTSSDGDELQKLHEELVDISTKTGLVDQDLLKLVLHQLAKHEQDDMGKVIKYVGQRGARVANGSFGIGPEESENLAKLFMSAWYQSETLDEAKVDELKTDFLRFMAKEGKANFSSAPNTLFVFAAGNDDGNNNDLVPSCPASIKADNTISVAATYQTSSLASFSNIGIKTVDVAAPGVNIKAAAPGGRTVTMSGTSQAAPFVTNVAAAMLDENENLTPLMLKQILMGTVDVKSFLKKKVASGGIVNKERAVYAARMSKTMELTAAIAEANKVVKAVKMFTPNLKIDDKLNLVRLPTTLNIQKLLRRN